MKPTINSTTTAVVTVSVRVQCGSWGPDCTMEQVLRQASEEAAGRVRRLIQGDTRVQLLSIDAADVATKVERR